jgi:hypothetical protein
MAARTAALHVDGRLPALKNSTEIEGVKQGHPRPRLSQLEPMRSSECASLRMLLDAMETQEPSLCLRIWWCTTSSGSLQSRPQFALTEIEAAGGAWYRRGSKLTTACEAGPLSKNPSSLRTASDHLIVPEFLRIKASVIARQAGRLLRQALDPPRAGLPAS